MDGTPVQGDACRYATDGDCDDGTGSSTQYCPAGSDEADCSGTTTCGQICDHFDCGTQCPICAGTGHGHYHHTCHHCGSSTRCADGSSSSASLFDLGATSDPGVPKLYMASLTNSPNMTLSSTIPSGESPSFSQVRRLVRSYSYENHKSPTLARLMLRSLHSC